MSGITKAQELREMAVLMEEWGMEKGDARSTALYLILGYDKEKAADALTPYQEGPGALEQFLSRNYG